jgi:hypothetical protein
MRVFRSDGIEEIGLSLFDCGMNQAVKLLTKLGILENDFAQGFTVNASIAGDDSWTVGFSDALVDGIAGREEPPREQVRLNDSATQFGKHPADSTLPCSNSTSQTNL